MISLSIRKGGRRRWSSGSDRFGQCNRRLLRTFRGHSDCHGPRFDHISMGNFQAIEAIKGLSAINCCTDPPLHKMHCVPSTNSYFQPSAPVEHQFLLIFYSHPDYL